MELLYILLVLLAVARGFGEIAEWGGQPALVGELLAGIAIGVISTYFHDSLPVLSELTSNTIFLAIADLGVFFLMLLGGVELKSSTITNSSKSAVIVALSGMLLPLFIGYFCGHVLFPDSEYKTAQSLFLGTALSITALPVSIRILMDIGKLETKMGNLIVASALIDDVLSLIILAILTGMLSEGSVPNLSEMGVIVAKVSLFFMVSYSLGKFLFNKFKLLEKLKSSEFEFTCLILVALLFSVLAEHLDLHFILGAFMAGLFFGRDSAGKETYMAIKEKLNAITKGFLAPIFFVSIGLHLDLTALIEIPYFVVGLVLLAFFSKVIGAGVPAKMSGLSNRDALATGVGMSGRGAVELIIADIALRAGLFSVPEPVPPEIKYLFSTVVIVAIVTTIMAPLGLKIIYLNEAKGSSP